MDALKRNKTIMVVEDHPMTRHGIENIIETKTDLQLVDTGCGDGILATERIRALQPELVVLDLHLPKKNGISIIADTVKKGLDTKFIIFSGNISNMTLSQLLYFDSVYGILLKEFLISEFEITLQQVSAGHRYHSPQLKKNPKLLAESNFSLNQLKVLTKTELKILKLTTQHLNTSHIADRLYNSTKTIKKHKSNIVKKLCLEGTNALYEFSLKNSYFINAMY